MPSTVTFLVTIWKQKEKHTPILSNYSLTKMFYLLSFPPQFQSNKENRNIVSFYFLNILLKYIVNFICGTIVE